MERKEVNGVPCHVDCILQARRGVLVMEYVNVDPSMVPQPDANSKILSGMLANCQPWKGFTIPADVKFKKNDLGVKLNYYGKKLGTKFHRKKNEDGSIFVWREA